MAQKYKNEVISKRIYGFSTDYLFNVIWDNSSAQVSLNTREIGLGGTKFTAQDSKV